MSTAAIRLLLVEDSAPDALLIVGHLQQAGFALQWERVETAEQMRAALGKQGWDLILADYTLPGFDALGALALAQQSGGEIPFLVVSGTIGEAKAVALMKAGARDCLLKDHLAQLAPAVARALHEAREQRERNRTEAALRKSEENFRSIFEQAPFGIYQSTPKRLLQVNPAIARMFGYASPADMLRDAAECAPLYLAPGQRRRIIQEALDSPTYVPREVHYRRRDGAPFVANLWMRAVRDEAGQVRFFEGFVEEITERKRLEEQLRQAQKMDAIGQLAGGVAHDFNNILAAILMQLGLLRQHPHLTHETKEGLQEVEAETLRAARLTQQLLLFSRKQVARIEPLDLNGLIHGLLKMVRRLLGENIQIEFERLAAALWVQADAGMLEQVVMNLCINARDAMPKGGRLRLGLTLVEREAGGAHQPAQARPGRFVCLAVSDTGCGMAPAVRERLFEPFFTTKPEGQGTGLGLATVYGIVQQHQGWVEVESKAGQGSTFRVYLPALVPPLDPAAPPSDAEAIRGGAETILLVEDELSVRRTIALCLRKLGYGVLEAGHGAEALRVWAQHKTTIALLLTDRVMLGPMTGLELAEKLRAEKPGLRVLLMSGYSTDSAADRPFGPEIAFLAKPFRPVALAKLVRQSLDQA